MTKKDENNSSEKEVYELWWEYLKRSELYKVVCQLIPEAIYKENNQTFVSFDKLEELLESKFKVDDDMITDEGNREVGISKIQLNQSFYNVMVGYMEEYLGFFGDIFNNSFDDWWDKKRKEKIKQPLQVIDFSDPNDTNAYKMINSYVKSLSNYRNELKKHLKGTGEKPTPFSEEPNRYLYLAIPMVGGVTMEEISKQIADIRKIRKKDFEIDDFYYRRFDMPVSRVRLKEMKHYLEVYDRWKKGMKMKDIISEMAPDRYGENILRSFRSDLQKAKKIIQNVECGSFPEEPDF